MLSNQTFYHSLLRKYVMIFGNIFNNINMIRYDNTGTELNRIRVPIIFAPKEKYVTRLEQDPGADLATQITLPRMSFDITNVSYDKSRKQNSIYYSKPYQRNQDAKTQYMGVPYDITFSLGIYSRNIDDANQIVEQILPYFVPDYTPTVVLIDEIGLTRDIPIILDSVKSDIQYEGGYDSVRYVMWSLDFTMKVWFWGPISDVGLIREVIVNIYENSGFTSGGVIRINTSGIGANGDYLLGDTVYQGNSLATAKAFGKVNEWSKESNKLVIGGYQGTFTTNTTIHAFSTNASYILESFEVTPLQLVKIDITPDPITANVGDPYGYTTVITEYPEI